MDFPSVKVSARTRELVRYGAAFYKMQQQVFVEEAVKEYIENHREEIEKGIERMREVLTRDG